MRKAAAGVGVIAGKAPAVNANGQKADIIEFSLNAQRVEGGIGRLEGNLQLTDLANRTSIRLSDLVSLGSVRNQCGTVKTGANAVEFSGDGLFNGKAASFRVCVQDNGQGDGGPEHIALADEDSQYHFRSAKRAMPS
jgi:hypothetical protein